MPESSVFIDSNCFLYSLDLTEADKRAKARDWIGELARRSGGVTNLQVLNEVTSVLLKRRRDVEPQLVFRIVDGFAQFGSQPLEARDVSQARRLRLRYGFSWWDSLLLASAVNLGCTHFLSEDLQDGQIVDSLMIVDLFAHAPQHADL